MFFIYNVMTSLSVLKDLDRNTLTKIIFDEIMISSKSTYHPCIKL
jgi:hypothetical protein